MCCRPMVHSLSNSPFAGMNSKVPNPDWPHLLDKNAGAPTLNDYYYSATATLIYLIDFNGKGGGRKNGKRRSTKCPKF